MDGIMDLGTTTPVPPYFNLLLSVLSSNILFSSPTVVSVFRFIVPFSSCSVVCFLSPFTSLSVAR